MSICIRTNKDLLQAESRLKKACDEMGIRLGKGDDKARKLICAVLNQPNWHVAISKVDIESSSPRKDIYIDCPTCGNKDSDSEFGFTFPNYEGNDFVVCQECGRRTSEADWNNPLATSLGMYDSSIAKLIRSVVEEELHNASAIPSETLRSLSTFQLFDLLVSQDLVSSNALKFVQSEIAENLGGRFSISEEIKTNEVNPIVGEVFYENGEIWLAIIKKGKLAGELFLSSKRHESNLRTKDLQGGSSKTTVLGKILD